MLINIKLFRRSNNIKLNIKDGELTLLKGDSGIGKSSIFEAITWCLYGSLLVRNVDCPVTGKKAMVQIKDNDVLITRNRVRSISIDVTYKGNNYSSKMAEEIIQDIFGPKELWFISCYLDQDTRNIFLHKMSEKNRLLTLHKIAFTDVQPSEEIKECDNLIQEYNNKKEIYQTKYLKIKKNISKNYEDIDVKLHKSEEETSKIKETITILKIEIDKLIKLKKINDENIIKYNMMRDNINNIKNNLEKLNTEYIDVENITNIKDLIKFKNLEESRKEKQKELKNIKLSDDNFTNKDYYDNINLENLYKINLDLCKSLDIKFDEDSINNYILRCQNLIEIKKIQNSIRIKISILDKLNRYENTDYTKEDYFNILNSEKIYKENKKLSDKLGIDYNNEKITDEIDNIKYILENQENIINIEKKNKLIKEIENIPELVKSDYNFTKNDLFNNNDIEKEYKSNSSFFIKLNIDYTKENVNYFNKYNKAIKSYIKRCKFSYCTKEEYENEKNKLKTLQDGLKCIKCPSCDVSLIMQSGKLIKSKVGMSTQEEVNVCKKIIHKMEEYLELSKHIPEDFVAKDFIFNLSDKDIDSLENRKYIVKPEYESKFIKEQIEINEKYEENINKLNKLNKKLSNLPVIDNEDIDITTIKKLSLLEKKEYNERLIALSNIKVINKTDISSDEINNILKLKKEIKKYDNIPDKLSDEIIEDDIEEKLEKALKIKYIEKPKFESSYIKDSIENNNKHKTLSSKINEINKEIDKLNVYTPMSLQELNKIKENIKFNKKLDIKIQELTSLINNNEKEILNINIDNTIDSILETNISKHKILKEEIELVEKANILFELKNKKSKLSKYIRDIHENIETTIELKKVLILSEKKVLNNVIANINNSINKIVKGMFKDPIHLHFSLVKILKNNKEKDGLSVNINFKSVNYDKIDSLSGGEKNRVSMAFTLAINRILNSKLLLLDEPCKSLDSDLIEMCLKTIRKYSKSTKIISAHGDIEGHYDNTINFN